jgi:hypothetical protein
VGLANFTDIQEGDLLQFYVTQRVS